MLFKYLLIAAIATISIAALPLTNAISESGLEQEHYESKAIEDSITIVPEDGVISEETNHVVEWHGKHKKTTHKKGHHTTHKKAKATTHKQGEATTAAPEKESKPKIFVSIPGLLPDPFDLLIKSVVQALSGLTGGAGGIAPADLSKYTGELTDSVEAVQKDQKLPGDAKFDPSTATAAITNLKETDSAIPAPVTDIFSGLLGQFSLFNLPIDKVLGLLGKLSDQTKAIQ
uniref:Secreted protein n=1 Tax=Rhabditophanes sp. KR3021 TaxID=114890 RepID=A0AC35TYK4_9BILA